MNTEPKEFGNVKYFDLSTTTAKCGTALIIFTLLSLVIIFVTLTEEYFDSFDYILSAWNLLQESATYFFPRNPFIILVHTFATGVGKIFNVQSALKTYQFPIFILNLTSVVVLANALKSEFKSLPWIALIAIGAWNRLFIHYAPFAMTDITSMLAVAIWFWVECTQPLNSHRGIVFRALAMAFCALGRIHTVVIPLATMAFHLARTPRHWEWILKTGVLSALSYFTILGSFFGFANHTNPFTGVAQGIQFYWNWINELEGQARQSFGDYFIYLFLILTPIGSALAALGFSKFWSEKSKSRLTAPLVGCAIFFLIMLTIKHKEARYLAPVLPATVALQAFALHSLFRHKDKLAALALVALFLNVSPELLHFRDPFYRSKSIQTTAEAIGFSTTLPQVRFLQFAHSFYPKDRIFHDTEQTFYCFHLGRGAMLFYTKKFIGVVGGMGDYKQYPHTKYGPFIPDDFQTMVPEGVTLATTHMWENTSTESPADILPVYLIRWFDRKNTTSQMPCMPNISSVCVQMNVAYPGYSWK